MTGPGGPTGEYLVTVDSVYSLVPEAERINDPNESKLPTPITEATVAGWIEDVSAVVSSRLVALNGVPDGPTKTAIRGAARTLVASAVASYVEAARYPTSENPYAVALWERYSTGLDGLSAQVDTLIDEGGADPGVDGGLGIHGGPFAAFPWPRFYDRIQW